MFDPRDRDDRSTGGRDAETLRHRYDWGAVRPSAAVVEMVAIATDREPSALEPLYEVIDPEAIDRLLRRDGDRENVAETNVSFAYAGYDVTIGSDGELTVTPAESAGDDG